MYTYSDKSTEVEYTPKINHTMMYISWHVTASQGMVTPCFITLVICGQYSKSVSLYHGDLII